VLNIILLNHHPKNIFFPQPIKKQLYYVWSIFTAYISFNLACFAALVVLKFKLKLKINLAYGRSICSKWHQYHALLLSNWGSFVC
jgi:hypothetical protein